MKICFIGDAGTLHAKRWAEWFSKKGHEVHLISRHEPLEMKNVIVHKMKDLGKNKPLKLVSFILDIQRVRKIIAEIQPDIVHGHYLLTYGLLGALSGFKPYIVTPWGNDISELDQRSFIEKRIGRFVLRKADFINVCDTACKERVIELGVDDNKVFVNGWGTDITFFKPNGNLKAQKGSENFTILITRVRSPFESIDFFLEAVILILKRIENVKFIILGQEELSHRYLRNKINHYRISSAFVLAGVQSREKVAELMASSDIFLDFLKRTTAGNPIGSSVQEAMSSGMPVVIGRIPSLTGVIEDGYNGMVFDWKDPSGLAEKIIKLYEDRELREKIGKKAREFAAENFNWEKNSSEMEDFYLKIKSR